MVQWSLMSDDTAAARRVVSEIFTNLAAGWFGVVLITPAAIPASSVLDLVGHIGRALVYGIACAITAIALSKEVKP